VYYRDMASDHLIGEQPLHPDEQAHRDWPYRRPALWRYGVAVSVVLIAFAIRYAMLGDQANRLVFTFFVPAALIAAWYGGVGPGLVATLLGLLAGDYFFLPPRYALGPLGIRESLALGVYAVTTAVCVILCERLHDLIRQFEHALEQERHHVAGKLGAAVKAFIDSLEHDPSLASFHTPVSWPFQRPVMARYGVAVAMVILAFALRYWLFGTQGQRVPFLFFVPAAMVATWYGGMAPGLLATAAGLMLGDYFFLSDHEALGPVREIERISIGMYAVTTTLCVMLLEDLHNRIRRLEHALEHARHHRQTPHPDGSAPGSPAVIPPSH
jgi:K+-sensing histidine kinase KdpD